MRKIYLSYLPLFVGGLFLLLLAASCKKDRSAPIPVIAAPQPLAKLGLYEVDSGIYKRIYIPITQIGTQKVTYFGIFDTGSTGMTIDANGILPASMITSSGIQVAGDSVNVNGITVTPLQATLSYGNAQGETQESGNLAYAPVTIGDANGNITTTRIPIFLYYKIQDVTNNVTLPAHSNDVFGVGPGVSDANTAIASPLSYFKTGAGVTSGFKLAALNNGSFTLHGTLVEDLLTIGLVPGDLATSSNFVMHPLSFNSLGAYSPDIAATISYNGQNVAATVLFDTGTPAITLLANSGATANTATLPANTVVTITTNNGFMYQYTTGTADNITQVVKPSFTHDPRTIFSLDFFINNEFLMDYKDHQIGLKNN
jgi:hypothetical protein